MAGAGGDALTPVGGTSMGVTFVDAVTTVAAAANDAGVTGVVVEVTIATFDCSMAPVVGVLMAAGSLIWSCWSRRRFW